MAETSKVLTAPNLSALQATILRLAYRHQREDVGATPTSGADVYSHEILHAHYGWPYRQGVIHSPALGSRRSVRHFSGAQIGAPYPSGRAAVSRALVRLEARGLVVMMSGTRARWTGANLTPAGAEIAASLVDQAERSP